MLRQILGFILTHLTKFGAGSSNAPTYTIHARTDQNAETALGVENRDAGTGVFATFVAKNGSNAADGVGFTCVGTGNSGVGAFAADRGAIYANTGIAAGLALATLAVAPIGFYTAGSAVADERLRIDDNETASQTAVLISVAGAAVQRVKIGAADSAGPGLRALAVDN
jgi:hypothetical protein